MADGCYSLSCLDVCSCFSCKPAVMANCLSTISSEQFLKAHCEHAALDVH